MAVGILTCHMPYGADVKVVAGGDCGAGDRPTEVLGLAGAAVLDFTGRAGFSGAVATGLILA